MAAPRFSVIIPALNEEKFLPKLLLSLTHQTYHDFEVIVVDGKSKDKTMAKAREFQKDLPLLTVVQSDRASLPYQRNFGAARAKGAWYVFIDADSVLHTNFFERLEQYINTHNPDLFTSWFRPDSEVSGDAMFTLIANMFVESSSLFRRPIAPGPLAVVKKDIFTAVGGYDNTLQFGEDYDFTKRVTEAGYQFSILRETLYVFSLRRVRKEGRLKFFHTYAKASLLVLLTKQNYKHMPGYIMGGHLYTKKRKEIRLPILKEYEKKFKTIMKELFD